METIAFTLETLSLFYFCFKINHLKITLLNSLVLGGIVSILIYISSLLTNNPLVNFFIITFFVFFLLCKGEYSFGTTLIHSILSFLIYFSLALLLNSFVSFLIQAFLTNDVKILFISELIVSVLPVLFVKVFFPDFNLNNCLKKMFAKIINFSKQSQRIIVFTIIFDLISLLGLFYSLMYLIKTDKAVLSTNNLILFILFFLLSGSILLQIFLVKYYNILYKYQKTAFENKSLKIYSTQLESSYSVLQEFRHDYIDILASLEYGITTENLPLIKRVFYSTVEPSKNKILESRNILIKLSLLREDLKSFLIYKISDIISQKIKVELTITTNLKNCEIKSTDFVQIFSILLDNAQEASSQTNTPFIKLMVIATPTTDKIIIANSFSEDALSSINKIFEKNFSTKENHLGLGLHTVKKIIGNYDNLLFETSIENNLFTQKIIIPQQKGMNKL